MPFRTVFMARWDPEAALDLIERERVTFMVGPPTFFVSLMQAPGFAPERVESLRLISSGGAGVSVAFVEEASAAFGAVVKRTYGSTEAPTIATSTGADAIAERAHARRARDRRGRAARRRRRAARARPRSVRRLPRRRRRTTTRSTPTAGSAPATSRRSTPTAGSTIVGRLKDVIIRGGENISTAEVEHELEAHPDVRQAVVVGCPDPLMGERVAAFVVGAPTFDVDAARAWFSSRGVARFKTPERVIVVDALPSLPTGKPDRDALRSKL